MMKREKGSGATPYSSLQQKRRDEALSRQKAARQQRTNLARLVQAANADDKARYSQLALAAVDS